MGGGKYPQLRCPPTGEIPLPGVDAESGLKSRLLLTVGDDTRGGGYHPAPTMGIGCGVFDLTPLLTQTMDYGD